MKINLILVVIFTHIFPEIHLFYSYLRFVDSLYWLMNILVPTLHGLDYLANTKHIPKLGNEKNAHDTVLASGLSLSVLDDAWLEEE